MSGDESSGTASTKARPGVGGDAAAAAAAAAGAVRHNIKLKVSNLNNLPSFYCSTLILYFFNSRVYDSYHLPVLTSRRVILFLLRQYS